MTPRATWSVALLQIAAIAQVPPAAGAGPATPAIELLLRAPRTLDAERLRAAWRQVLDTDVAAEPATDRPWVRVDGDALAGAAGTVHWSATVVSGALPIDDHAVRHLGDENRATVRRHLARIVVRADGTPPPDAARRTATYRVLGGVAAALLETDVVAVGAAHLGTFSPIESYVALREQLTDPDPLSALAPYVATFLLIRRAAPLPLVPAAMRRALATEFSTAFRGTPDDLVVVNDGTEGQRLQQGYVRIGETTVVITAAVAPAPTAWDFDVTPDLRCRAAMRSCRGSLGVRVDGFPDDDSEATRRRTVARVVAALSGDDIQVLSWNCASRSVIAPPDVTPKLRADDPVQETTGVPAASHAGPRAPELLTRAAAAARDAWPTAAAHHRSGGEVGARFTHRDVRGEAEDVWITVQAIEDEIVRGTVDTATTDDRGLRIGAVATFALRDLTDWVFERDGKIFGAHLLAALEAQRRPK